MRKESIGDHLKGEVSSFAEKNETAADSVGGFVQRSAPFVYIDSVPAYVEELLGKYSDKLLTWHDGQIPDGKIWIKFGADHGGNSFKMSLQVLNLKEPNSKESTIVFAIAMPKTTIQIWPKYLTDLKVR